jgi:hypothetical protein
MKGTLTKINDNWVVKYPKYPPTSKVYDTETLPLHPDNVADIEESAQIFDNIEARIAAENEVKFDIVISALDFVTYAKLR